MTLHYIKRRRTHQIAKDDVVAVQVGPAAGDVVGHLQTLPQQVLRFLLAADDGAGDALADAVDVAPRLEALGERLLQLFDDEEVVLVLGRADADEGDDVGVVVEASQERGLHGEVDGPLEERDLVVVLEVQADALEHVLAALGIPGDEVLGEGEVEGRRRRALHGVRLQEGVALRQSVVVVVDVEAVVEIVLEDGLALQRDAVANAVGALEVARARRLQRGLAAEAQHLGGLGEDGAARGDGAEDGAALAPALLAAGGPDPVAVLVQHLDLLDLAHHAEAAAAQHAAQRDLAQLEVRHAVHALLGLGEALGVRDLVGHDVRGGAEQHVDGRRLHVGDGVLAVVVAEAGHHEVSHGVSARGGRGFGRPRRPRGHGRHGGLRRCPVAAGLRGRRGRAGPGLRLRWCCCGCRSGRPERRLERRSERGPGCGCG
mmetsp:Transcript_9869/g.27954  ORF Transcript_9869/g.27954 Transcript_9869/m.27954 type:complete len:430 (+) Transcript_9869:690-1979(+)